MLSDFAVQNSVARRRLNAAGDNFVAPIAGSVRILTSVQTGM